MKTTRLIRNPIRKLAGIAIASAFITTAHARGMTCGLAVNQLQSYVAQVNGFANSEYYQGIPMRCGPNPQCLQWWVMQLNAWYAQQTSMVNGWYQQLIQECGASGGASRIRVEEADEDGPGEMDEDAIDDLEVDDEDRTVRIRIPSTPNGFRR